MAVTYDGALYAGPEPGSAYYSVPYPDAPTPGSGTDVSYVWVLKVKRTYFGQPDAATGGWLTIGQTTGNSGGGGGNDGQIFYLPANAGTSGNRKKLQVRMSAGGQNITSAGTLTSTSTFSYDDTVVVVFQSNGGTVQLKTCKVGSGTVVTEATGTRNNSWPGYQAAAWQLGLGAWQYQSTAMVKRALTDAEILSWAAGTDPESIVSVSGDRMALWLFNVNSGSISSTWGTAGAATLTGSMASYGVGSALTPNATNRIQISNEPVAYGAVSLNDDGTDPTWTFTGTYTGTAPTAAQYRLLGLTGTVIVDWTDATGFTASAGTLSGTTGALPAGGLYRIQVRDKNATTVIWKGANPFNVCPVTVSTGQSPYVLFQSSYPSVTPPTNAYLSIAQLGSTFTPELVLATVSNTGRGLAAALNTWSTLSGGLPIIHVACALTGTSSTQWATKATTTWSSLLAALDFLRAKRVLIQWLNGAADGALSAATIKSNHDTILANLDADVATTRGIGYRYRILPHQRDTSNPTSSSNTRTAQYEWAVTNNTATPAKVMLPGPWWSDMQTDAEATGTVVSATSTTATLANNNDLTAVDLVTNGAITILTGTGAGQTRTITAYNDTSKVATVAAWTTTPDATSTYRVTGTSAHPGPQGVTNYATRYGYGLAYAFGKTAISGVGPKVTSATYPNGATAGTVAVKVKLTHRHGSNLRTPNGGTTATAVAGFAASEDNFVGLKTITAQAITGPDEVTLTVTGVVSLAALKVQYLAGAPIPGTDWNTSGIGLGDTLYDDSGIAPTGGLPALFTLQTAPITVTEAPPAATALVAAGFFALA